MILQALNDYYMRRAADPDPARRLPTFGSEEREIPFILELTRDGRLAGVKDTRSGEGKKRAAARFRVPKGVKKTSGVAANLLWDNAEYVLGMPDAKKLVEATDKGKGNDYLLRLVEMRAAFRQRIASLPPAARDDEGIRAVLAFLDGAPAEAVAAQTAGPDIASSNPIVSFRLVEDDGVLVCQRPLVQIPAQMDDVEGDPTADEEDSLTPCLITGDVCAPERLHTAIKGVWGAQTAGANIVSFNLDAFNSFGKAQGANAPISAAAAFAYTTALNRLLDRDSRQRMQVGDASTVFWAQRDEDADMEDCFVQAFGKDDDPDAHAEQMRAVYDAIHTGRYDGAKGRHLFFVLGLAPNAARLSVRFWHAAPLSDVAERIRTWFDDLVIVRAPFEPEFPSLRRVLSSVCQPTRERPHGDIERLPQTIAGDLVRAILVGDELPALLLNRVLQRCRAEQARKDDRTGKPTRHVNAVRAGLIRASLNRYRRIHQPQSEEITVSLDTANTQNPYLLGRLFAVYERMQEIASERDLNRTIRDTYFGAAMATPAAVFPRLARLNQIHARDVRRAGRKVAYFDKLLQEISDKLDPARAFPASCPLRDQGAFTIGYYHQRQDFFARTDTGTPAAPMAEGTNISGGTTE